MYQPSGAIKAQPKKLISIYKNIMFKYNVGDEVCFLYGLVLARGIVISRWKILWMSYYNVRSFEDNFVHTGNHEGELWSYFIRKNNI